MCLPFSLYCVLRVLVYTKGLRASYRTLYLERLSHLFINQGPICLRKCLIHCSIETESTDMHSHCFMPSVYTARQKVNPFRLCSYIRLKLF